MPVTLTSKKTFKEWTMDMPWGKVAMASWGSNENPPILMVHGFLDTCASFSFLIEQLPDTYYCVGFDFPGHGKSDPFPPGPVLTQIVYVEVVRAVVEHMKWERFTYLCHSLGFLIGTYYNNIFPGKISKMINIDPTPTFSFYHLMTNDIQFWAEVFYVEYYMKYKRSINALPKHYTYDDAVDAVSRARHISYEQAEVVLSRSLVPVGNDLYKLSWEPKVKRVSTGLMPPHSLYNIISANPPPMLNLISSRRDSVYTKVGEKFMMAMMEKLRNSIPVFLEVVVEGGHDVHITNPQELVPLIEEFLSQDYKLNVTRSKL